MGVQLVARLPPSEDLRGEQLTEGLLQDVVDLVVPADLAVGVLDPPLQRRHRVVETGRGDEAVAALVRGTDDALVSPAHHLAEGRLLLARRLAALPTVGELLVVVRMVAQRTVAQRVSRNAPRGPTVVGLSVVIYKIVHKYVKSQAFSEKCDII